MYIEIIYCCTSHEAAVGVVGMRFDGRSQRRAFLFTPFQTRRGNRYPPKRGGATATPPNPQTRRVNRVNRYLSTTNKQGPKCRNIPWCDARDAFSAVVAVLSSYDIFFQGRRRWHCRRL